MKILSNTVVLCMLLLLPLPILSQGSSSTVDRITVDAGQRFQIVDGFGVNFNGTYFRAAQKPMIDMLIDDLGATLFRLDPYGLSNWEAENDNADPQVMNWEYYNDRYSIPAFEASWAAARYLNARGIRPVLALSGIAPDWMLDDNAPPPKHRVGGAAMGHEASSKPSHLKPAMYEEFAETVVSLAVYARTKAHIDFDYFGPVNETECYPKEGPRVDPAEMPLLLRTIARRLTKEGLGDVKLVVAEQCILANDFIGPILKDGELMRQVGVFAFHSYRDENLGPDVERVRKSEFPRTAVWLTEYGGHEPDDRWAENEWMDFCLGTAPRALRALNQGASAALFWDAYDNYHEHYPRMTYHGLVRNADHVYSPKKRYYAAKQLYHFVRPGSQRIAAASDSPALMVSAFRNGAANSYIIVGVKQGGPSRVRISLSNAEPAPVAWELYETTRNLDCVRMDMVAIKDGIAQIDLPDEAIFTLVSSGTRDR